MLVQQFEISIKSADMNFLKTFSQNRMLIILKLRQFGTGEFVKAPITDIRANTFKSIKRALNRINKN